MKRKILITLVVLAAGLLTFFGFSRAAEMVQDTEGIQHFHVPKVVSSAIESLGITGVGLILMIIVITVAVIVFRGKGDDTI